MNQKHFSSSLRRFKMATCLNQILHDHNVVQMHKQFLKQCVRSYVSYVGCRRLCMHVPTICEHYSRGLPSPEMKRCHPLHKPFQRLHCVNRNLSTSSLYIKRGILCDHILQRTSKVYNSHLNTIQTPIQTNRSCSSDSRKCFTFASILKYSPQSNLGPRCKYSTQIEKFSVKNNQKYLAYLESLENEYNELSSRSSDSGGGKIDNKRLSEITPVVLLFKNICRKYEEMEDLDVLIAASASDDQEMVAMATKEKAQQLKDIAEEEEQLLLHMAGEAQMDRNDIILEVSAGVGGQEAMLFTRDMFRMYENFAQNKGWTFTVISYDPNEIGGIRKASALIQGTDVFKYLKFEGGVHRVQRNPQTEKTGRVHTSTMTVAILPQPEEIDVVIQPKDLVIETFRAGGSGGQHVNTTDSAVRITHIPTKTIAECQVQRSQLKNRKMALQILRSRIYESQLQAQTEQMSAARKLQTGSGGRSEKIRTYNFPQDRVSDHRLGENWHHVTAFMKGSDQLDEVIVALLWANKCQIVDSILDEFEHEKRNASKR